MNDEYQKETLRIANACTVIADELIRQSRQAVADGQQAETAHSADNVRRDGTNIPGRPEKGETK